MVWGIFNSLWGVGVFDHIVFEPLNTIGHRPFVKHKFAFLPMPAAIWREVTVVPEKEKDNWKFKKRKESNLKLKILFSSAVA